MISTLGKDRSKVICGDVLLTLYQFPPNSVDTVITSPPYFGMRHYGKTANTIWGGDKNCKHKWGKESKKKLRGSIGATTNVGNVLSSPQFLQDNGTAINQGKFCVRYIHRGSTKSKKLTPGHITEMKADDMSCTGCGAWKGQLGLEPTHQLYTEHLMEVFREVKRVLKPGGSFWLNIGDSYSANRSYQVKGTKAVKGSQPTVKQPQAKDNGLKPKSMVGIPERIVLAMLDDGWTLVNKIVWAKQVLFKDDTTKGSVMPASVQGRFNQSWESLYLFTKSTRPTWWKARDTGEWTDTKPEHNPILYWVNRKTQKSSRSKPKSNPVYGKSKLWRQIRKWRPFDSYFDLDAVRVPFNHYHRVSDNGTPTRAFNLRVGDAKAGRLKKKWGNKYNPSAQEIKNYDKKNYKSAHTKLGPKDFATDWEYRQYIRKGKQYNFKSNQGSLGQNPGSHVKHSWQREGYKWSKNTVPGFPHKEGRLNAYSHPLGKNPPTIWLINSEPFKGAHFAVFPQELVRRPVLATCPKLGIVLDPFCGSGRTGIMALKLGRQFIGIDINPKYCKMAEKALRQVKKG